MPRVGNHRQPSMRHGRRQHFTVLPRDHPIFTTPDNEGISRDGVHFLRQCGVGVLTTHQVSYDLAALPLFLELLPLTHVLSHSTEVATNRHLTSLSERCSQERLFGHSLQICCRCSRHLQPQGIDEYELRYTLGMFRRHRQRNPTTEGMPDEIDGAYLNRIEELPHGAGVIADRGHTG